MQNLESSSNNTNEASIGELIAPYLRAWPWILISILVAMLAGHLYLRYTTKSYQANASIIIKDTQRGGGVSELTAFQDIGVLGSSGNSLDNEIEILTSKRLISKVVQALNLDVTVLKEGNIKTTDVYQSSPFRLSYIDLDPENSNKRERKNLYLKTHDESSFFLKQGEEGAYKKFLYLTKVPFPDGYLLVEPRNNNPESIESGVEFKVIVRNPENAVADYGARLAVNNTNQRSSVLNLSLTDHVLERAKDFLNQLIVDYNKDAINDKNLVASNTAQFIEDRIEAISFDLDSVETEIQEFKISNDLFNIEAQSEVNLQSSNEFTKQLVESESQIQIANYLREALTSSQIGDLLPGNIGLENLEITAAVDQYNQLALRYQELLKTSTELNPAVIRYQTKLESIRESIISSLEDYLSVLRIKRNALRSQESKIEGKIAKVPQAERVFRGIARNQTIIESIYLFLITKREETAISLAVTAPKAKVVDAAWGSSASIAPKPNVIYMGAFVSGLVIPLAIIYVLALFYNKIESRKDLNKKLPNTAILGEIPKLQSDESEIIQKNDRSVLAESFRILRTNLQYKLSALPDHVKAPVIIVTSSVKGEGKTFVAFNLAMTMANSGKNILLIGGDIRNPQLHRYLAKGSKSLKGVTEFLVYPEYKAEELIHESDLNSNLKFFLSGAIPPNPAELWLSPRVDEMLEYGRSNYDAVIIDSAPSMLVTDTLLISDKADLTAYVSRANYTEKPLLDFVKDTIQANKLKNVAMILNNVKMANFGYGNKYAYSYGVDKDSTWTRLLKKLGIVKT